MRNKQVDGIKGLAAFIIMLYHLVFRYQQIFLGKDGLGYWIGEFGSYIFLIISVFFISLKIYP